MPEQNTAAVKESRARRAKAVADEMHRAYLERCVGKTFSVLFEQPGEYGFTGHAPNYMEVAVKSEGLHNSIKRVKITGIKNDILIGELT